MVILIKIEFHDKNIDAIEIAKLPKIKLAALAIEKIWRFPFIDYS